MLFSRDDVANFINQHFEPVWESVRPVPILTIDFGDGRVVTRTLHGNIATYVCTQEGEVIDILPGVYEPAAYIQQLSHLVDQTVTIRNTDVSERAERQRAYHRAACAESAKPENREPVEHVVPKDLAKWNLLIEDTKNNETVRRRQIHAELGSRALVQPEAVVKWLYKDVLHADLDDPYLGLGGELFADYPFAGETGR